MAEWTILLPLCLQPLKDSLISATRGVSRYGCFLCRGESSPRRRYIRDFHKGSLCLTLVPGQGPRRYLHTPTAPRTSSGSPGTRTPPVLVATPSRPLSPVVIVRTSEDACPPSGSDDWCDTRCPVRSLSFVRSPYRVSERQTPSVRGRCIRGSICVLEKEVSVGSSFRCRF